MRLSIGEMSKLFNVSIHTLRYYDKIGLLKPSEVDPISNYRYYDEQGFYILGKIKDLKLIGLPLNKIKPLLDGTIEEAEEAYKNMRENALESIDNLNQIVAYLDDQLQQIDEVKSDNCYIEPQIITLPKREGCIIDVNDSSGLIERIEAIENFGKKNNTNAEIFYKPSRLMSFSSNVERSLQSYLALKRDMSSSSLSETYILDEGEYGVIDHIGVSRKIEESYKKLLKYIKDKGKSSKNEAIEILAINSTITSKPDEWRTQIQIPIK